MKRRQRTQIAVAIIASVFLIGAVVLAVLGATARSIGLVADLIGILTFAFLLYRWATRQLIGVGVPEDNRQDVGPKPALRLERHLAIFLFLLLVGLAAAALGGALWAVLNWLNNRHSFMGPSPYVGGELEPHGWAAVLWAVSANLPIAVAILILMSAASGRQDFKRSVAMVALFVAGTVAGALVFYDVPIGDLHGFRAYLQDETGLPFMEREFWLVILWSTLIAGLGFAFSGVAASIGDRSPARFLRMFPAQLALGVPLTVLVVAAFLLPYPSGEAFATARGFFAGGALRVGLFFGLLLSIGPLRIRVG